MGILDKAKAAEARSPRKRKKGTAEVQDKVEGGTDVEERRNGHVEQLAT